jgi:hypothetical protein
MHEALCRSSGTTLDSVHAEDGPPITQRTSGLSLRDLLAAFPIVREIEIERVALDLDRIPENIAEIRQHTDAMVEVAAESGGTWDRAIAALRRIDPTIQAATDNPILQRSLIADKLLVLRNFGGAAIGGLNEGWTCGRKRTGRACRQELGTDQSGAAQGCRHCGPDHPVAAAGNATRWPNGRNRGLAARIQAAL